ncbi:MAG: DUF1775 domain-containing protein [Hyphomicrobium sp.]
MTRYLKTAVAASALATTIAAPAFAHVSIDNAETKGGAFKARFNVPHGCDGSATTAVKITIPEGVIGVKPTPKPGWTLATTKGAYAKTYDHFHGMKVSDGVKSVTWSGGKLLNEHLDEFVLGLFVTGDFKPGATVYFPVEQTCETGSLVWSEIPVEGQSAHDLKSPAPSLRVVAKVADSSPTAIKAGALTIESPWLRATPGGATVGAGYVKITNTGSEADRLTGGDFAIAGRVEVHEMKMDGDVMKMRALPDGLVIKPGETIALAPGGAHLMLMDLKGPIAPGPPVKGKLTFEKAGVVEVEFAVAPIGATAPDKSGHANH